MNNLIYTLMIAPSLCLGFSAECNEVIIDSFIARQERMYDVGIDLCSKMIEDDNTEKRDLVHLYIARMKIYEELGFFLAAANDKDNLKHLLSKYPECIDEYLAFYDDEFVNLINH